MAERSQEVAQEASTTFWEITDLVEDLEAGNAFHTSEIREKRIASLKALLYDLDTAVVDDDEVLIQDARSDYQALLALTQWQQEAAHIEWSAQYAEVVEALGLIAEGSPPRSSNLFIRLLGVPIIKRWTRSGGKQPLPLEVRQAYAFNVMTWIDNFLGKEAPTIQKISQLGVLNTNDVPALAARTLGQAVDRGATAAVALYRRRLQLTAAARRAEEEANPGIVRTIWGIVTPEIGVWDSYSEFAFDVGLILVTGSGGAFVKWGKTVAKGVRNAKLIVSKSKRFANLADEYRDELKRIERARESIQERLKATKVGSARREALEGSADRLQKHYRKTLNEFIDIAISANKAAQAKTELLTALKEAWAILQKIGVAAASEQAVRALESEGLIERKGMDFADIAIDEVHKVSTTLGVNSIGNLGSRIDDAKDLALRAIFPPNIGNKKRLYVQWLYLLVTRQIVVRLVVITADKQGLPPTRPEVAEIVVKSVSAAFGETLFEIKVPKAISLPFVKQFVKATEQILAKVAASVVAEIVE